MLRKELPSVHSLARILIPLAIIAAQAGIAYAMWDYHDEPAADYPEEY